MDQSAIKAKETLGKYKYELDKEIEIYFDKYINENKELTKFSEASLEAFKNVNIRGGKRVRASLVHFIYKLFGGNDTTNIQLAEIALEINNAYILVMDDIQDRSPLRRGNITIHEKLRQELLQKYPEGSQKDLAHIANSQAMNIYLIGAYIAQLAVLESGFNPSVKIDALTQLANGNILTAQGQILDIYGELEKELSEEDIKLIMELKTANYTFINPLLFGATFAGVEEDMRNMLVQFGTKAGIAFQIQDDILGMFGDEEKVGKPSDSDLREGKHTLLINHALENASKSQLDLLNSALGNEDLTKDLHDEVKTILIETGSLENSKRVAQELTKSAQDLFVEHREENWDDESFDYLFGLTQYMIEREM
jgi:geranylgeranyl diphosphate synthase type I